jgi:SpoIID/LytB domain protein
MLRRRSVCRIGLFVTVALVGIVPPQMTAQAAGGDATFVGHGWGHGRGMGQYGALGYAVQGQTSAWILNHFYGGTTAGTVANLDMTVDLTAHDGKPLVVTGTGLTVNSTLVGAAAVRLTLTGSTVKVEKSTGCTPAATSWVPVAGAFAAKNTVVTTTAATTTLDQLLSTCETTGKRAYRGSLTVASVNGSQRTINRLPIESYLRGVVPRESPAYWGSLSGGKGMQALQAQAVAARSYALASTWSGVAHTCDTTSCQVYGGAGTKEPATATTWTVPEEPLADQAIRGTAGLVRTLSTGLPARTEFSSSTGGYTAGGVFTAVVDAGDSVSSNPNHTWTTTLPLSAVAADLGTGAIRTLGVTARNGLGADGGRATNVKVVSTSGVVSNFTGDRVQTALGLKSNWFSISSVTPAEASSVVSALYQDLLLRPADAAGLASWSLSLSSGAGQPALVAALTRSREYDQLRVGQAYRNVLGRAPDGAGLAGWTGRILAGSVAVDDVQRQFFSSQEFVNRSGGTSAGFVKNLYQSMLHRSATVGEVATWVAEVGPNGRAWVVDQVWFSTEAASARAGGYYTLFLKRAPDSVGLASWTRVLLTQGEPAVRVGIAGSAEYLGLALTRFP